MREDGPLATSTSRAYHLGMIEEVILVDDRDQAIGAMEKLAAHREGGRLHRAFSIFVFDSKGRLLLQQRAAQKYHFALRWSNTCCGHPRPSEETLAAAGRRLREEFGFECALREAGTLVYRVFDAGSGLTEHEFLHVIVGRFDGTPRPNADEIAAQRWIEPAALARELAAQPERFSPWFALAYQKVLES